MLRRSKKSFLRTSPQSGHHFYPVMSSLYLGHPAGYCGPSFQRAGGGEGPHGCPRCSYWLCPHCLEFCASKIDNDVPSNDKNVIRMATRAYDKYVFFHWKNISSQLSYVNYLLLYKSIIISSEHVVSTFKKSLWYKALLSVDSFLNINWNYPLIWAIRVHNCQRLHLFTEQNPVGKLKHFSCSTCVSVVTSVN
jgi:hypothetical protein